MIGISAVRTRTKTTDAPVLEINTHVDSLCTCEILTRNARTLTAKLGVVVRTLTSPVEIDRSLRSIGHLHFAIMDPAFETFTDLEFCALCNAISDATEIPHEVLVLEMERYKRTYLFTFTGAQIKEVEEALGVDVLYKLIQRASDNSALHPAKTNPEQTFLQKVFQSTGY